MWAEFVLGSFFYSAWEAGVRKERGREFAREGEVRRDYLPPCTYCALFARPKSPLPFLRKSCHVGSFLLEEVFSLLLTFLFFSKTNTVKFLSKCLKLVADAGFCVTVRCYPSSLNNVSLVRFGSLWKVVAWETSRHFIPYWWRVTIQIWVVLLIGWKFVSSSQKHYPDLNSDTSSVWNFYARFTDIISRGNPPVASQNVGCLLTLGKVVDKNFFRHTENQAVIIFGPQKSRDYY